MTALQIIALRGPQFSADPRLGDLITLAAEGLDATVIGGRYQEALALKVLHILTMEQMSGASAPGTGTSGGVQVGAISSKSEGDLSISYHSSGIANGIPRFPNLSSTVFGQELEALLKTCGPWFMNGQLDEW